MSWSAALSGAASRVLRAAAGRRALEAVLLVGAVFVFGMLCGERAQAADGVPREPSSPSLSADTVEAVVSPPVNGVRAARLSGEARRAVTSVTLTTPATLTAPDIPDTPDTSDIPAAPADSRKRGAADPARPLAGPLTGAVGERAVRPVGELVGAVTGRPATSLGKTTLLPVLPEPPVLPDLKRPAPLPGLPEAPTVPGHTLPAPLTPDPEPGAPAPRPESPTTSTPPTPPAPPAPPSAGPSVPDGRAGTAVPVASVPEAADAGGATRGGDGHGHGHGTLRDAVHTDPAPEPHAPGVPGDRPDGTVGNGTPRHGDTPAVTPCPHPSPRLVPGAVERTEVTGTQDRYRDVPVSPA
ncbi:hypothetical protein ACSR0Z_21125 [Streptomyces viridosporus]